MSLQEAQPKPSEVNGDPAVPAGGRGAGDVVRARPRARTIFAFNCIYSTISNHRRLLPGRRICTRKTQTPLRLCIKKITRRSDTTMFAVSDSIESAQFCSQPRASASMAMPIIDGTYRTIDVLENAVLHDAQAAMKQRRMSLSLQASGKTPTPKHPRKAGPRETRCRPPPPIVSGR